MDTPPVLTGGSPARNRLNVGPEVATLLWTVRIFGSAARTGLSGRLAHRLRPMARRGFTQKRAAIGVA